MIKQGRERTNAEIIQGLDDLRRMIPAGLPMTSRHEGLLDDAARRIGDQEERIDILTAELPDAGRAEGEGLLAGAAHLAADALSLLKAQEPKKLRCIRRLTKVMKGICPVCEMEIESVIHGRITKFCKFCGQAVKWDG